MTGYHIAREWRDMEQHDLRVGQSLVLELPQTPRGRWQFLLTGSGVQTRRDTSPSGGARWRLQAVHPGRLVIAAALYDADGRVIGTRNFLFCVELAAPRVPVSA